MANVEGLEVGVGRERGGGVPDVVVAERERLEAGDGVGQQAGQVVGPFLLPRATHTWWKRGAIISKRAKGRRKRGRGAVPEEGAVQLQRAQGGVLPQRGGDGDDGVQGKAARAEGQRVQGTVGADGVGDGHARAEDQGVVAACGEKK